MLNKFSKIILFYFAYLPLFSILIINNIKDTKTMLITLISAIIVGFILAFLLFKNIKSIVPSEEKITITEFKNSEYLSILVTYIVTYISPFLVDLTSIRIIISFSILLILVAYLYIDTPLFCVNPLLKLFFKFNLYQVTMGNKKYYLISKNKHNITSSKLNVKRICEDILIED